MQISIFGLGHAGTVTSACIADAGHGVIAVDIDAAKVRTIHLGRSPIIEPGLNEIVGGVVARGLLRATTDYEEAVLNSDLSLICVGTSRGEDGTPRLDHVRSVCSQIGAVLRKKNKFHSVVLRSAVVPGTARSVVIPTLEEASGKTAGVDFGFANNPWFLRESMALHDYFKPPEIVIGMLDEKTAKATLQLYSGIRAPEIITSIEAAETANNDWHALKVA